MLAAGMHPTVRLRRLPSGMPELRVSKHAQAANLDEETTPSRTTHLISILVRMRTLSSNEGCAPRIWNSN